MESGSLLNKVLWVVALFTGSVFLIPPQLFWEIELYSKFDFIIRFILAGGIGLVWLYQLRKKKRIDGIIILFLLFSVLMIFSTVLHSGDIKKVVWSNTIIPLAIMMGVGLSIEYDKEASMLCLFYIFWGYIICNLISVIYLYPRENFQEAMSISAFFGNRNTHIYYFFIMLLTGGYAYVKGYFKKKALYVLAFFTCIASFCFSKGITTLVLLSIWAIYLIVRNWKVVSLVCTSGVAIISNYLLFFVMQLFVVYKKWNGLQWLSFLNRRADFNGRFPYWKWTWEWIADSPFIGHGCQDMNQVIQMVHPHSLYLHVLFDGGIVGFLLFTGILIVLAIEIQRIRNMDVRILLAVFLFCILLAGQVDETTFSHYALYAGLIYYLAKSEAAEKYEV